MIFVLMIAMHIFKNKSGIEMSYALNINSRENKQVSAGEFRKRTEINTLYPTVDEDVVQKSNTQLCSLYRAIVQLFYRMVNSTYLMYTSWHSMQRMFNKIALNFLKKRHLCCHLLRSKILSRPSSFKFSFPVL